MFLDKIVREKHEDKNVKSKIWHTEIFVFEFTLMQLQQFNPLRSSQDIISILK